MDTNIGTMDVFSDPVPGQTGNKGDAYSLSGIPEYPVSSFNSRIAASSTVSLSSIRPIIILDMENKDTSRKFNAVFIDGRTIVLNY